MQPIAGCERHSFIQLIAAVVAMPTRNLAILFTDMKGFTARVSGAGRDELAHLRERHDALLLPVFRHFNGEVVKSIGDAFLVCFDTPTESVLCGLTIQEVLRQYNQSVAEADRIEVRVAINSGEVERSENDVLGEAVNVASRLEEVAEAGEVYFTEAVYLAMNRNEAPSAEVGELQFRGVPYPIRVYRALQQPDSRVRALLAKSVRITDHGPVIDLPRRARNGGGKRRMMLAGAAIVALLLAGLAYLATRPDATDLALAEADRLLREDKPLAAFEQLDLELARSPAETRLREKARDAAAAYATSLRAKTGSGAAQEWLDRAMADKSYLEALRPLATELDAEAAVSRIQAQPDEPSVEISGLLTRHPNDPNVALVAARGVRGKVFAFYTIGLFSTYLERGGEPLPEIEEYCEKLLTVFSRTEPSALRAHEALRRWYPEQRLAWARQAMTSSASGRVLANAMVILAEAGDPLATEALSTHLIDLGNGYAGEAEARAALDFFAAQEGSRREQILGLHRWVLNPDGSWGSQGRDLVASNLGELERRFGATPR